MNENQTSYLKKKILEDQDSCFIIREDSKES